jgi:hypothetical protein
VEFLHARTQTHSPPDVKTGRSTPRSLYTLLHLRMSLFCLLRVWIFSMGRVITWLDFYTASGVGKFHQRRSPLIWYRYTAQTTNSSGLGTSGSGWKPLRPWWQRNTEMIGILQRPNSKALVVHLDRVVWRQLSDNLSQLASLNAAFRPQKYF